MHFCSFFASKMISYCPLGGRLPATAPSCFLQLLCSCNTTQDQKRKIPCAQKIQLVFPPLIQGGFLHPSQRLNSNSSAGSQVSIILPKSHISSRVFQATKIRPASITTCKHRLSLYHQAPFPNTRLF